MAHHYFGCVCFEKHEHDELKQRERIESREPVVARETNKGEDKGLNGIELGVFSLYLSSVNTLSWDTVCTKAKG